MNNQTSGTDKQSIARILHDDIGQPLMALKFAVGTLGDSPEKNRALINEMNGLIGGIQTEVRKLLSGLQTEAVEQDLKTSLLGTISRLRQTNSLKIKLEHSKLTSDAEIPVEVKRTVVKTVEEVLGEIISHADATRATVKVWNSAGNINVRVTDNGRRVWLSGVYQTVLLAKGRLVVDRKKKKGTVISAKFPTLKGVEEKL